MTDGRKHRAARSPLLASRVSYHLRCLREDAVLEWLSREITPLMFIRLA